MRTLALDGRMGASGDMLLGALLAAGADPDALAPVTDALDVTYHAETVNRQGIAATAVTVAHDDAGGGGDQGDHHTVDSDDGAHGGVHGHTHGADDDHDSHGDNEHGHDDNDGHSHDNDGHSHDNDGHSHDNGGHSHDHGDAEGHGPDRSYPEVLELVAAMALPPGVAADARAVFERLGEAEAAVHGTDLDETTFHEVGTDDAIADVVGVALLLDDLGVESVVAAPVSAGGGEVTFSHGTYPVPTPAVVEIAADADFELRGGPVDFELLTPTGAALLAHFAEGVADLPSMRVTASGYGAGSRDVAGRPNVLRALVGERRGALPREEITVLETNLDDATPEVLGGLQETLAEAGARDVSVVPLSMKKSRPGHLVRAVVRPEDAERVARRLVEETGTLGVRDAGATHRWVARRHTVAATVLEGGERHRVAVKIATDDDGARLDVSGEYDDAARVARETGLPTREVLRRAEGAVRTGRADRLVHLVAADRWERVEGAYRPDSLDAEGSVHLSTPDQVLSVAATVYPDADDPLLLVVDPDRVDGEIRYEEQPSGEGFAHVYGPLEPDAVVDVLSLPREDGRFVLPEELR